MKIQDMINALPKQGGIVSIPAGVYHEPLWLSGAVKNLVLRPAGGQVVFDGSGAPAGPHGDYGLRLVNCQNIHALGITWQNWHRKCIHATDCADLQFIDCRFLLTVIEDGAHFSNSDRVVVDSCEAAHCGRLHDGKGAHGIYLSNGGADSHIIGCNLHDMPAGAGIQVNATEGRRPQVRTFITGNTIRRVYGFGIQCAGMAQSTITGNAVEDAGHGDTAVFLGAYGAKKKQWACRDIDLRGQSGRVEIEDGSQRIRR